MREVKRGGGEGSEERRGEGSEERRGDVCEEGRGVGVSSVMMYCSCTYHMKVYLDFERPYGIIKGL